jgi:hypothetical protein
MLALIALGFFLVAYRGGNTALQGKIVVKDFTRAETDFGSRIIYYVIAQDNNGKQLRCGKFEVTATKGLIS